ncbi:MAG TPA: LysM domain-containing protein, partial [Prolixibacteraceae bacterium]|nr:LysM domain-containing protein [Prolixibacteraceae bacterium]
MRQLLIALFLSCFLISLQAQESAGDKKIVEAGQRYVIHRVKAGETLYSIGRRYQVSLEEISKHNPQATGILKPGDVLKIPEKESALPEAVTPADQYDIHIIPLYLMQNDMNI